MVVHDRIVAKRSTTAKRSAGYPRGSQPVIGSSDGLEGSCSESSSQSCGSTSETACLQHSNRMAVRDRQTANQLHHQHSQNHHHQQQPQPHYVSSEGSIYQPHRLPRVVSESCRRLDLSQLQSSTSALLQSSNSPNSSSTTNAEPVARQRHIANQRNDVSQQHRRLQHEVHQQLQRIYGSAHDINQSSADKFHNEGDSSHETNNYQADTRHKMLIDLDYPPGQIYRRSGIMSSNQSAGLQQRTYESPGLPNPGMHQMGADLYPPEALNQKQNAPICAIPEECSDDDELLLSEVMKASPSERAAIERKNKLEDLHYATVTAAALLSATANAAAAIAATETEFERPRRLDQHQSNEQNVIYADTYQDLNRQHQHRPCDPHPVAMNRHKIQQQQQRSAAYPDSRDMRVLEQRAQKAPIVPTSVPYGFMNKAQVTRMPPIYSIQQCGPLPNFTPRIGPPMPPQPPMRKTLRQVQSHGPSIDLLRQHHQHQQQQYRIQQQSYEQLRPMMPPIVPPLAAPSVPPALSALAIVHGGKNAMKTNLLSRMLMNNMVVAQRSAPDNRYGQARIVAPARVAGHKLATTIGQFSKDAGKLYAIQPPMFSVGMAPSDVSGHLAAPLVLERKLKKVSLVDRICRIDLTLFWWLLLLISFIFVGIGAAVSKYFA